MTRISPEHLAELDAYIATLSEDLAEARRAVSAPSVTGSVLSDFGTFAEELETQIKTMQKYRSTLVERPLRGEQDDTLGATDVDALLGQFTAPPSAINQEWEQN